MELSILILLLILLGVVSGIVSTIAGIGGGVFFVSIITLGISIPIDIAVDTSTFIILFSSFSGFISYLRQKRTNLKLPLIFSIFAILGSILTSIIFFFIPIDNFILKILFACTLLVAGMNMIYKISKKRESGNYDKNFLIDEHDYKTNFKKSIPLFLLAGFTTNLLGIGGGIVNTPTLNIILDFPIHNATAISTAIIFFTAIYNTILKSIIGQINYIVGIFLAIGSVTGSIIGAKISNKMPKIYLQIFVAITLMLLAIRMFFG
ncbi:MAG: sulfite exporter TauE/SafE family protein [Promethearchaeota archaeon]|nr:MAG: sulfite exporter TauE/SafE family protein [Candidatus Lokiarchaeota archaeon]